MNKFKLYMLSFLMLFSLACEEFVTDVDPLIDRVTNESLESEEQLEWQLGGIEIQANDAVDHLFVMADLMSDALYYDESRLSGSTWTDGYGYLEYGTPLDDNRPSTTNYKMIALLRFTAEGVLDRVENKIQFSDTQESRNLKARAIFKASFYIGYSKYLLGSYFGIEKNNFGGTINLSAFIPRAELYDMAVADFNKSLEAIQNLENSDEEKNYNIRLINSFLARMALIEGDYSAAESYANKGLLQGDDALLAKYDSKLECSYLDAAYYGSSNVGFGLADKFVDDYVSNDPEELKRISYDQFDGIDGNKFYRQNKYNDNNGANVEITLMSWQEVALIKAESAIRSGGNGDELVNLVRASHGMSSTVNNLNLEGLLVEREKELLLTGIRLLDQVRTGTYHNSGKWECFPIPLEETSQNNNF